MKKYLYHNSPVWNRDSIGTYGLLTSADKTVDVTDPNVAGGIYLTDKPRFSQRIDTWRVKTSGLAIEEDYTGGPEDDKENWYVSFEDIPPDHLELWLP